MAETFLPAGVLSGGDLRRSRRTLDAALHEKQSAKNLDRRFYRAKYDSARELEAFARTARDEVELEVLAAELLRVVEQTVQPERVSLWLKK